MRARLFKLVNRTTDLLDNHPGVAAGVAVVALSTAGMTGLSTATYLHAKANEPDNDNPRKGKLRMYGCFPFVTCYHEDSTNPQSSKADDSESAKLKM